MKVLECRELVFSRAFTLQDNILLVGDTHRNILATAVNFIVSRLARIQLEIILGSGFDSDLTNFLFPPKQATSISPFESDPFHELSVIAVISNETPLYNITHCT